MLACCSDVTQQDRGAAETPAPPPPPPAATAPAAPTPSATALSPSAAAAETFPGTGVFLQPAKAAAAPPSAGAEGGVSFNFVNADVREVVREILGGQLHLAYVVDPKVQATITVQTGAPLPREAVLPALENVLQANGVALVQRDGVYRVLPMDQAAKASIGAQSLQDQPGYGMRLLPLRYAAASELKTVLEPFLPPGGVLQVDSARNLLIVTGSSGALDGFADLVRQFDVNWMAGTSFALYRLRVGAAKDIAQELEAIFGEGGSAPVAGLVRILPIERLNAILVISPQRAYLGEVKRWVDRLDLGDDQTTPRLFEYRVQNSRAADLAAVLTQLFASGSVKTVEAEVAPGSKVAAMMAQQGANMAQAGATPGSTAPGASGVVTGAPPSAGAGAGAAAPSLLQPAAQRPTSGQQAALAASGIGAPGPGPGELALPAVRIVADEKNNALIIFARPRDYRMIEDTIKRLDVVPLQVLIEATIAEVTLNDNLQYGLQWFFSHASNSVQLLNNNNSSGGTATGGAADIMPQFSGLSGFNYLVGGGQAKAVLSALSQLTTVTVVSAPQLLVLDHQTAALQVGDQVPIISQSAQSVVVSGAPIVNSVEYLNTGVILQVTPRVNTSGQINLDIDQSVSDVSTTTTSTIDSPTITQRRIVTSVIVQDGETIALGGLIIDNKNTSKSGIPVLSNIPVVGTLFGTTNKSTARTELLVLLSPRIVRSAVEARSMTDELRNRMRAVKPLERTTQ
jgi:general secretion pathway protein D